MVAKKAAEVKDIRVGLYLLREAGMAAEDASSKKIMPEHVTTALDKMIPFTAHDDKDLDEDTQLALDIIKEHSGKKIGDLFKLYGEKGGASSYKTFQRKIAKLDKQEFISTEKVTGQEGNTTLVTFGKEKKLTDY